MAQTPFAGVGKKFGATGGCSGVEMGEAWGSSN